MLNLYLETLLGTLTSYVGSKIPVRQIETKEEFDNISNTKDE